MKLRTLDCKNCAAPLRQEGGKLVCGSCGSVFDIPCDANDIEYDRIINAEDYIRLELAKSIVELENSYKTKEQINREKRDAEFTARRVRTTRALKKGILVTGIVMIVVTLLIAGLLLVLNNARSKKRAAKKETETVIWDPGYRITPSDLKHDKTYWDYINSEIIKETKEDFDSRGSVIFSSDEIWGVNKDPEIIDRRLITTEDSNDLYIIFKVTFENIDGSTKEMYCCCAAENLKLDKNKKIVSKKGFTTKTTDSYDYRFHCDSELDDIYQTYINHSYSDYDRYVFVF